MHKDTQIFTHSLSLLLSKQGFLLFISQTAENIRLFYLTQADVFSDTSACV